MRLNFDEIENKEEEITFKLKPTYFGYIIEINEADEEVINLKEINLTIKNNDFR